MPSSARGSATEAVAVVTDDGGIHSGGGREVAAAPGEGGIAVLQGGRPNMFLRMPFVGMTGPPVALSWRQNNMC